MGIFRHSKENEELTKLYRLAGKMKLEELSNKQDSYLGVRFNKEDTGYCKQCDFPVIAVGNIPSTKLDWLFYCTNKDCVNHHGTEMGGPDWPMWCYRK
jgi:hypothetical protein